ncbi:methyltransferase [Celerinatantimonas diazotrophica]|uniref:16S rRNA (Guanine1207-N2)-methyltransferase/23S rRNA (Guanine1835-N2)-methyltransferase n=1 Tax=Celerinatantimonas diazotrophica TaxID=412034 RepID=A0A4V2PRF6_9GAMM|nr:methyltransferase [Celerinatantimonas diazotrophica]TCK58671.1 16S rRNA (guanine1207-N2)-methyltransferase/23S rRNA (guanine1835-N2)-methyltransferase [Celerinatantimonas diazotrophica]CAG9297300.1 Ribosomal RNA large subunit methyltransferase G [Celerinatantimonas diazotrophica]
MNPIDNQQFVPTLSISRYPKQRHDSLKGWNGADTLLVEHVIQHINPSQTVAIFNDEFGALSCALDDYQQVWYSDSYLAHQGVQSNRADNHLSPITTYSTMAVQQDCDVWLIKIPKSLSHLEHQLATISEQAHKDQPIILSAMVKYLNKGTFKLIERYLGPLSTSLAKYKARLIFTQLSKTPTPSPYPRSWQALPYPWQLSDHANVFCLGKLDIGTRFLLEHMPEGEFKQIIDLGCGNGLLSLAALDRWPQAHITCCDESLMATESTRTNLKRNFPEQPPRYQVLADHCLSQQPNECADLILCNPPFHQQQTISTAIARQMFTDAKRCLTPQGQLCVIANRHLPYWPMLKKSFQTVKILASNAKFVILIATK